MCAIAVAQTDGQGSKFPGQEAIIKYELCVAVHGVDGRDTCYTDAKIDKTKVDSCLANAKQLEVLLLFHLAAAQSVGVPPFVKVGDNPAVPSYDKIKEDLCKAYPTLSPCGPPPPPPTPPPPPPTPTPTPSGHYGMPPCLDDEVELQIQGEGGWCAAGCFDDDDCPQDVPSGTAYYPECSVQDQQGNAYCAIPCDDDMDCGDGATCSLSFNVCEYGMSAPVQNVEIVKAFHKRPVSV